MFISSCASKDAFTEHIYNLPDLNIKRVCWLSHDVSMTVDNKLCANTHATSCLGLCLLWGPIHQTGTCGWIREIREMFGFEKSEVFWTSVSWQDYWRPTCLWLPLTLNCNSFGALQPPHPLFPFIASHQLCRNSPDAAVMPLTADVPWHIPIKSGNVTNIEY